ncbi:MULTISPECIES: YopT-type cysteine protease domain-containing protein [Bradyrhizobium]|uniref:YopT-type cysteine protease domain-containing protein n=1 Tax=Bradyrhizobium TaxID=374 RepID=UPI001AD6091A|nr:MULTISPECIES: YopT-type cysteine protease domain-containing protein [Bradyrhizobium]MBO4227519.1 YopT-type cysteine protease domain-containing protein [Bradyrhizobium neotropicale]MCA1455156.1 C58 family peptidase [Bradyrhizobium sp. BRP22]
MYNRISGSSTGANQAIESNQFAENGEFAARLAELALQGNLSFGEVSDKMGLCCSKPHTSDAHIHTPSSSSPSISSPSSSSSPSSPPRPTVPLFDYRTAELPGANVDGICVGLAAEWLLNLPSSPSSRMRALRPGSQSHASAAVRQQRYQDLWSLLRSDGAPGSHNLHAISRTMREAGLDPSREQTRYGFGTSSHIAQIVNEIAQDPSVYLLSLRFAEGGAHTIATSTSNGMTTLFDPNYGEFTVRSNEMGDLFRSLGDRYRNLNGYDIATVTTQKVG